MRERLEAERRIWVLIEETESLRAVVGEVPGEMGIIGRSRKVSSNLWRDENPEGDAVRYRDLETLACLDDRRSVNVTFEQTVAFEFARDGVARDGDLMKVYSRL
jgi:hypothetical protein